MFDWIKYRWNLNKLYAKRNKKMKKFEKTRKKAKTEESEDPWDEEAIVYNDFQQEINSLISGRFCQIANKLLVPLPDYNDKEGYWTQYQPDGWYYLTVKGIWELKKLIRKEKKERRDGFIIWISTLTGIIGATTGLVAVMVR
jgi:hypothetical protein